MTRIPRPGGDARALLFLAALVAAATLPFLGHAYHIDETLFLRIARQVKQAPLDPYGFDYLWNLDYEPMHELAAFPPLMPYYLAAVTPGLDAVPELVTQLAVLPFAFLAAFAVYALLRLQGFSVGWSAAGTGLFVVSPAFVLAANLAMPDMAAVALAVAGMALTVASARRASSAGLGVAGLLLGLSTLMRYNTLPLVPLLFLMAVSETSWRRALVPSLAALVPVSCWLALSARREGGPHAVETLAIFASLSGMLSRTWALGTHLTLSTYLPFVAALAFRPRSAVRVLLVLFLVLDVTVWFGARGAILQFAAFPDALFFGAGLCAVLALAAGAARDLAAAGILRWPPDGAGLQSEGFRRVVLFAWAAAALAVPLVYVHVASKYLLLAQPPLIVLLLLRLRDHGPRLRPRAVAFALTAAFAVSLLVAASDFEQAGCYRTQAARVLREVSGYASTTGGRAGRIWFLGHWGFQYYMEGIGALPLPVKPQALEVAAGDWVIVPRYCSVHLLPEGLVPRLEKIAENECPSCLPIRTMSHAARAGFYSNYWGPLPYTFSTLPLEDFVTYRAVY